ncbi:hypothetical protein [Pseudomonas sp. H2_G10]
MITFGHAEFAQLILEVFALLQDRALLRGLSRKKLIVNARSAGIIISLEPVYAMALRVVVAPWSAVISDVDRSGVDRSGVDCAVDCVVGTECGGIA